MFLATTPPSSPTLILSLLKLLKIFFTYLLAILKTQKSTNFKTSLLADIILSIDLKVSSVLLLCN